MLPFPLPDLIKIFNLSDFHQSSFHWVAVVVIFLVWALSLPSTTMFVASLSLPLLGYGYESSCFLFPQPKLSRRSYPFLFSILSHLQSIYQMA